MNIADKNNDELNSCLEKWISGLSTESTSRVYSVCNILRSISELSGDSIFTIPYATFEKANIDIKSVEIILTELWRKEVIDLMDLAYGHCVSSWNKEFEPDNSFCDSTMVDLGNELFDYIFQVLQDKKTKNSVIPEGRDYIYEKGVLLLRLRDGSPCILDLSNADHLRPVFESFFYLYNNGTEKLFSRQQLLDKHKELSGNDILWKTFIKRKSTINGKMINKKKCLKNRIAWEYIKELNKYRFEILPLSDN